MPDLKSELMNKVILNGTTGLPLTEEEMREWENEERARTGEDLTPVSNTDRLYACVKSDPGHSGAYYRDKLGNVKESSVSSLLTQLRNGGWLRSVGKRGNMVFYPTDKVRPARTQVPQHLLAALEKARIARSEKTRLRREEKARAKAAGKTKKEKQSPSNNAKALLEVTRTQIADRISNGGVDIDRHYNTLRDNFAARLRTMSAKDIVDAVGVRTAKELYDELGQIFGR